MRKKTIAILFGLGFGLILIATFFYIGGFAITAGATASCDYSTYSTCDTSAQSGGIALVFIGVLLYLGGAVLHMISWIATLIKQAQRQQWAWFVCTLLFSSICMLIWLIVEPEFPRVQYVPVYQPLQPGYPPVYQNTNSYPSSEPPYYQQDPYRPQ